MSLTTAASLLRIYSLRLKMQEEGITSLSEPERLLTKTLVEKLSNLDGEEQIEVDAKLDREPFGKFMRVSTGEVLAEIFGMDCHVRPET